MQQKEHASRACRTGLWPGTDPAAWSASKLQIPNKSGVVGPEWKRIAANHQSDQWSQDSHPSPFRGATLLVELPPATSVFVILPMHSQVSLSGVLGPEIT